MDVRGLNPDAPAFVPKGATPVPFHTSPQSAPLEQHVQTSSNYQQSLVNIQPKSNTNSEHPNIPEVSAKDLDNAPPVNGTDSNFQTSDEDPNTNVKSNFYPNRRHEGSRPNSFRGGSNFSKGRLRGGYQGNRGQWHDRNQDVNTNSQRRESYYNKQPGCRESNWVRQQHQDNSVPGKSTESRNFESEGLNQDRIESRVSLPPPPFKQGKSRDESNHSRRNYHEHGSLQREDCHWIELNSSKNFNDKSDEDLAQRMENQRPRSVHPFGNVNNSKGQDSSKSQQEEEDCEEQLGQASHARNKQDDIRTNNRYLESRGGYIRGKGAPHTDRRYDSRPQHGRNNSQDQKYGLQRKQFRGNYVKQDRPGWSDGEQNKPQARYQNDFQKGQRRSDSFNQRNFKNRRDFNLNKSEQDFQEAKESSDHQERKDSEVDEISEDLRKLKPSESDQELKDNSRKFKSRRRINSRSPSKRESEKDRRRKNNMRHQGNGSKQQTSQKQKDDINHLERNNSLSDSSGNTGTLKDSGNSQNEVSKPKPKDNFKRFSNKRRKNSQSPSKHNFENYASDSEESLSLMDKLRNEELLKKASQKNEEDFRERRPEERKDLSSNISTLTDQEKPSETEKKGKRYNKQQDFQERRQRTSADFKERKNVSGNTLTLSDQKKTERKDKRHKNELDSQEKNERSLHLERNDSLSDSSGNMLSLSDKNNSDQEKVEYQKKNERELHEPTEDDIVWNGGLIKPAKIIDSLQPVQQFKLLDPRMEREKLKENNDGVPRVECQMGESCSVIGRHSEGSFQPLRTSFYWERTKGADFMEKEFDMWDNEWQKIKKFKVVNEVQGDLFEQPDDFSLAHCVAEDLRMGSGIAVAFKREFKNLPDLLDQRAKQGGIATIHDPANNRYIYYLVTKRESTGKPTYYTMWKSLYKMREHVKENEVKKIATPRLGCGLDRLEWDRVKSMMEYLFRDFDIEIKVCNFQQTEQIEDKKSKCKLVVEDYPITKISEGTLIIYFTSVLGPPDNIMLEISKRTNFLPSLQRQTSRNLGDIVYHDDKVNNLGVVGCFVRETPLTPLSFKSLHRCLQNINKKNKLFGKDMFNYVAFQWVDENAYSDDCVNQKIITLLINTLRDVDVYVCTGSFDREQKES